MNNLSLIAWAGGKGRQINELLPLIPESRIYVEPFGGGAAILLNKPRSEVEVYNDLDHALVNLWDVVRDRSKFDEFCRYIHLTPYSRAVFEECLTFEGIEDPIRRAAAFYTVLNQAIGGKRLARKGDWSRRRDDNRALAWFNKQEDLQAIFDRFRSVQIECRDAMDILQEWDSDDTTFYCDPPYILETRAKNKYYAVEPGDEYHNRMVEVMVKLKGAVVLSGYDHPIYEVLSNEYGWWTDLYGARAIMEVVRRKSADGAGGRTGTRLKRTEIVYRNAKAAENARLKNPMVRWTGQGYEASPHARVDLGRIDDLFSVTDEPT